MKILLVCPEHENTFWNVNKVLKIAGKKSTFPPLGLLTVSAMLPKKWEKKLIDLNCENLLDEHIKWADYVFISAIVGQKKSTKIIINIVKRLRKPIVAGGPLFTTGWEEFTEVDTFVLGEAEDIISVFIKDLKNRTLKKIYSIKKWPDIRKTPIPDWGLINMPNYYSMSMQLSRGCPYNCEFCDVVQLNGRISRTKSKEQLIAELDSLYNIRWQGEVFFVDDNFIGNKTKIKKQYLPAIIEWQKKKKYPFAFNTQVSINIADDDELMELMTNAGFTTVFVGIETPNTDSLKETGKHQNRNRDLIKSVKKIQNMGLEVWGGFIVGFDSDKTSIFQRQIEFIQKSGIVYAMVNMLIVLPKTRLYRRLKETKRLIKPIGTNNDWNVLKFIPKMGVNTLIDGYKRVMSTIYSPESYYERIKTFLKEFKPKKIKPQKYGIYHIRGLLGSIWFLGFIQSGRYHYWKLIFWSLFRKPGPLPYAVELSLNLIHFRTLTSAK